MTRRGLEGIAFGALIWLVLFLLGVPNVFHLDPMIGLLPFALIGLGMALTRFRGVVVFAAGLSVIVLVIVAYTPFVVAPARSLIRNDPLPASADAVIVLSAGVTPDGYLQEQGLDRLLSGLSLIKRGVSRTLIITREGRKVHGHEITTTSDQDRLIALVGVPNVLATPLEASTHDEALGVKEIARKFSWRRVIVVTSPFHTRRACATFEHVGLPVTCVAADSRDIAARTLSEPHDRIGAFAMWIYEVAATLQYWKRGWI